MTLQKGDTAEDFELLAHDGTPIKLSSYKNSKNVVLCFYPKNHLFACPSKKVFEMAKSVISVYPEITATDTVVFAISVDSVDSQADFVKEYEIPYVHISDKKKSV
ncbi:MAG: redoxin domain-containing protein [Thermoproteota archaeon]|nr:redoxin domain-containing protein [Thermoproteota archaeon]